MFERPGKREDFPALWSPTTTSYDTTMRFGKGMLWGIERLPGDEVGVWVRKRGEMQV
jgi:hypothetical protein